MTAAALLLSLALTPAVADSDASFLMQVAQAGEQFKTARAQATLNVPASLPRHIDQALPSVATIIVPDSMNKFSLLGKVLGRKLAVPGSTALGTGWVAQSSPRGLLVVTNAHVVSGREVGGKVFVQFPDHADHEATVVGKNVKKDLALLLLPAELAKKYPPLPLGDSEALRRGDGVFALGSPHALRHTATGGIFSTDGFNADLYPGRYLQTDAAINSGNSGGPLIGMDGRVVGVNFAVYLNAVNLGFAIPVEYVKQALAQYDRDKTLRNASLGAVLPSANWVAGKATTAKIQAVAPGSPADKAGLKAGDEIEAVDGLELPKPGADAIAAVLRAIADKSPGDALELAVNRDGKRLTLTAVLSQDETDD